MPWESALCGVYLSPQRVVRYFSLPYRTPRKEKKDITQCAIRPRRPSIQASVSVGIVSKVSVRPIHPVHPAARVRRGERTMRSHMQKCIAHLVIPSLKTHRQGISSIRVTFWLSSRSVGCWRNRSADRNNAICYQVSVWEKIKTHICSDIIRETLLLCKCSSILLYCFQQFISWLIAGGSFSFLIRPAPPILPFNAWQVLARVLYCTVPVSYRMGKNLMWIFEWLAERRGKHKNDRHSGCVQCMYIPPCPPM